MRRFILSFFLIGLSFSAYSQSTIKDFYNKISNSCTYFTYSYSSIIHGTKFVGEGDAYVQSTMFFINLNNLQIYGDGQKTYTVDREAREVLISTYADAAVSLNPGLLLSDIEKAFTVKEEKSNVEFEGKSATKVFMTPKSDSEILELSLYFSPSSSQLIGLEVKDKDGIVTSFTIPSITYLPVKPAKFFHPGNFDSSYIVTEI